MRIRGAAREGLEGESPDTPPLQPLYDLDQTFQLHSRPGANRVIYLDFDGHDGSTTSWGPSGVTPIGRAFDLDGNETTFNTTERQRIQYIWARVAEDYLQYDIDVTTEDPGVDALKKSGSGDQQYGVRVVIGGSNADWYGSGGGVAYLRSFDDGSDNPCWVFPKNLSNSEKNIAEASSHEAGHTLGLSHDGKAGGTTYYSGHANWAPIMGVAYSKEVSQWSKGEYADANQTQDDLALMLSYGAVYRADDHGNSTAAATPIVGANLSGWGIIETRNDVDFFSFESGAGPVSIAVNNAPRGPNLDIQISLYNAAGTLLTSVDDSALDATLNYTVPSQGTYYFAVDGVGTGSPITGYNDYSSLGQFTISGSVTADATWAPTVSGDFAWLSASSWAGGATPHAADAVARLNNNITGDQGVLVTVPTTLGGLVIGDANASHAFTVQTSGTGQLTFRTTHGNAWISKTTGAADVLSAALDLQTDLRITNVIVNDLTLSGPITGPGSITKHGAGRVILDGTNTHGGSLTIAEGVAVLGASAELSAVPEIDVLAGAILDASAAGGGWTLGGAQRLNGGGTITGAVVAVSGSRLAPGGPGMAGTLTLIGSLALNDGAVLEIDLAESTGVGGGTNDLVHVEGDLSLDGLVSVDVGSLDSEPVAGGSYILMTYSGGLLTGDAGNLAAPDAGDRNGYAFDTSIPGEIRVQVSGQSQSLVWQGDGSLNQWDVGGATNWLLDTNTDAFFRRDSVLFNSAGSTTPAVALAGSIEPGSVTVNSSLDYTFSGTGSISGDAVLTKQGSGSLTVNTANEYSGATLIQAGSLIVGNASALGDTNGATIISAGGGLDVNGLSLGDEPVSVAGAGPGNLGAIVNNSALSQQNALRQVTLTGTTTFGGVSRWDIRAKAALNLPASLTGNNFALLKQGANDVWLVDLGDTGLGAIFIYQGTLGFQGSTTMGTSATTLMVNPGATLGLWQLEDNPLDKPLVVNNATVTSESGRNVLTGQTTLAGTNTLSVGEAAVFELRGNVVGAGGITKTGAGILRLAGNNTFSGPVTVSSGTVRAGSGTALGSGAGATTISSGARLDVAAQNLGAEVINVSGNGISSRGAIINSLTTGQNNALRFVNLTGNTTFGGNGRWDIRANPSGHLNGAYNLTKTSDNTVWLVNLGTTQLKTVTINEGTLGFQGTTTMGDPAGTVSIVAGGTLGLYANAGNILNKVLSLSSGTLYNGNGANTFAGSGTLSSVNTIDVASGTTLILSGTLGGLGSFEKTSAGTLVFSGNNTFTGSSTHSAGAIQVGDGGATGALNCNLENNASLTFDRTADLTHNRIISGTGTLTKLGSNTLTLGGANSYSGSTTISAGTVRAGHAQALGSSAAGTTVADGAALDVNGLSLGEELVTVQGVGVDRRERL